jgi:hypothetical protein
MGYNEDNKIPTNTSTGGLNMVGKEFFGWTITNETDKFTVYERNGWYVRQECR